MDEIVLEERRYRKYTGSNFNEYVLLTKKFFLLCPIFLCGFCCNHYVYLNNNIFNYKNTLIHIGSSVFIVCFDRIIQYPSISVVLFLILSLSINNDIVFYIFHQYLIYGIIWIIAIKLCDFEDGQRLYPGYSLLHTPSIYINRFFENYSRFYLIIPYSIILVYTLLFHQKWKHEYNYESHISEKSKYWWFAMLSLFTLSHWVCSDQLTQKNIILKDEIFDIYKILDIEYLQYKGIYTFVIMFITNSQIFTNFSWRILAYLFALFFIILMFLDEYLNFDKKYNIIDTLAFGLSYFMFEPINMLVYTIILRENWWFIVPINVLMKTILISIVRSIHGFFFIKFIPFWAIFVISIHYIQNEFVSLDI